MFFRHLLRFIPALLFFSLFLPAVAQLPSGYSVSRQFSKPCRINTANFPWHVYSTDPRFNAFMNQALVSWNAEGTRLGFGPFFLPASTPEGAELVVDWSGTGLPSDKAAGVFWDINLGYKRVLKISVEGGYRVPDGNKAQILLQEFGHVLGLDHSQDRDDIMFETMHTRRMYRVTDARLTQRDRAALEWLYSQNETIPILGLHEEVPGRQPKVPQPSFTPLPSPP